MTSICLKSVASCEETMKIEKKLLFTDDLDIRISDKDSVGNIIDMSPMSNTKNGIHVRVAASHSAMRINNRIYPPDKMEKGARTFYTPHPKPLLVNHDTSGDPLGRIRESRYVDTSGVLINQLKENKNEISDFLLDTGTDESRLKDFLNGKGDSKFLIDIAKKLDTFSDQIEGYMGAGFLEIGIKDT
jgi:hypothetical protein